MGYKFLLGHFQFLSDSNSYLYVPCDLFKNYKADPIFGLFKNIECIPANEVVLDGDKVCVMANETEVLFSMPFNSSANSYSLTISSEGETICTLSFNANGMLSNIDFANLKAGSVSGFQFNVTGLSLATNYKYSFVAKNLSGSVLKEYTGSFTTKNADGTGGSSTTAIDDVELANAISIVNNQIFVNGEAPAFVITSLGQKVANQNLKAGIYFVQVGNEMQGVVVK